ALNDEIEVRRQRGGIKSGYKNIAGCAIMFRYDIIRALPDQRPNACIEQKAGQFFAAAALQIKNRQFAVSVFFISQDHYLRDGALGTAVDRDYLAAYRGCIHDLRALLVEE